MDWISYCTNRYDPKLNPMISMLFFVGCSSLPPFTTTSTTISNINLNGTRIQMRIEDGKITELEDSNPELLLDYEGTWILPTFIDSHVHLAYYPVSEALLDGGVAAAVDLAAPISFFEQDLSPLQLRSSGPMITSVQGYPTQSWGSNGYGIECDTELSIEESISNLHAMGAALIKIPLTSNPTLSDELLTKAVQTAKFLGLPTVSHAMNNEQAQRAAEAGVDILAHTPTGALNTETRSMWQEKAVISTLHAFGSSTAVSNLSLLYQEGATILYGTDLGNTQTVGISQQELNLLLQAGMSHEDIIASGTSIPANMWNFSDLGYIQEGFRASFLVLDADPHLDITTLSRPLEVWIDGKKRE